MWIVGLVNSFNMLDNMDGLSGGVAAIAAAMLAAVLLIAPDPETHGPQLFVAGFLLVLVGSLLGFLWHNRPPARLFMGDAGSYFIGFCLAVATIAATFAGEQLAEALDPGPLVRAGRAAVRHADRGRHPTEARPQSLRGGQEPLLAPADGPGHDQNAGRAHDLSDHGHLRLGRAGAAPGQRDRRGRDLAARRLRIGAGGRVGNDRPAEAESAGRRAMKSEARNTKYETNSE